MGQHVLHLFVQQPCLSLPSGDIGRREVRVLRQFPQSLPDVSGPPLVNGDMSLMFYI